MVTCLGRGFGPARPSGIEWELPPAAVVEGEHDDPWRNSLAEEPAPIEALDEADSRLRDETVDIGEYEAFSISPPALNSVTSDTFDVRLVLRIANEDDGRLLMTDRGRDGVRRPLAEYVGEVRVVRPWTSTRGVSETCRRPW